MTAPAAAADERSAARTTAGKPTAAVPDATQRDERTDPLTMFRLYSESGLIDADAMLGSLHGGGAIAAAPIYQTTLDARSRRSLRNAFSLALERLDASPSCRSLYESLGTDGLLALTTTVYLGATSNESERLCERLSAVAYTHTGQQTTVLCPTFAGLPRERAAMTLLHEALHYAGLTERPGDPAAMSSAEISSLIAERCGF